MGVLVEPLPTFAGPSNEEVALFHNYRLNGDKTAELLVGCKQEHQQQQVV